MSRSIASIALALALVAAACGDDTTTETEAPDTSSAAETTTTAAPTSTAAATTTTTAAATTTTTAAPTTTTTAAPTTTVAALPDTALQAPILDGDGYKFGNIAGAATADELPFPLGGAITARWYTAGDRWVVVYDGLDVAASGALCPGNSILNAASGGFEFISNSPTPGAQCVGAPNVVDGAVMMCNGQVSYATEIPTGIAGTLFASIEVYPGDGNNLGASVPIPTDGTGTEIDPATLTC